MSRSFSGLTTFEGNAVKLDVLVSALISAVGQRVVDKTGLTCLYDMKVEWVWMQDSLQTVDPGLPRGPSILDAVQEELGLRLVPTKAPTEVLVIDSVQRPSEN